jgi:hypothetical protein
MTAINAPALGFPDRATKARTTMTRQAVTRSLITTSESSTFLATGLLIASLFLGAAIAINDGRLHYLGLQWLAVGIVAASCGFVLCRSRVARGGVNVRLLETMAVVGVVGQIVHVAVCGVLMTDLANVPLPALWLSLFVMAEGIFLVIYTNRKSTGAAFLLGGFVMAGFACVWTTPNVKIDVLMFQTESADALLHGEHPYGVKYRDVYWPTSHDFYGPGVSANGWLNYSFPYPPASLLLVLPGQMLGDVRWAHLAAITLSAALIMLAARNKFGVLAAAVLLTSPRTLFVVQTGWTEPLLILGASMILFCGMRFPRAMWAAMGLFIGLKQYLVLVLPLLKLLGPTMGSRRRWRQMVLGAAVLAVAIAAPFLFSRPAEFVKGVIEWQLVQPFRYDALSFPAMWAQLGGREAGPLVPLTAAALAIALCLWKAPRNVGGFLASAGLVMLVFFAANKQAFCNYYLLVIGLWTAAGVGLVGTSQRQAEPERAAA